MRIPAISKENEKARRTESVGDPLVLKSNWPGWLLGAW